MFVKEPCTVTALMSRLLITAITSFEAEQRTLWNLQANQGAARRSEPSPCSAVFLRDRPFRCHLSQTERAQILGDHQRQQDSRSAALERDDCGTTLQHTPVERTPDSTAQTPPRRKRPSLINHDASRLRGSRQQHWRSFDCRRAGAHQPPHWVSPPGVGGGPPAPSGDHRRPA